MNPVKRKTDLIDWLVVIAVTAMLAFGLYMAPLPFLPWP